MNLVHSSALVIGFSLTLARLVILLARTHHSCCCCSGSLGRSQYDRRTPTFSARGFGLCGSLLLGSIGNEIWICRAGISRGATRTLSNKRSGNGRTLPHYLQQYNRLVCTALHCTVLLKVVAIPFSCSRSLTQEPIFTFLRNVPRSHGSSYA